MQKLGAQMLLYTNDYIVQMLYSLWRFHRIWHSNHKTKAENTKSAGRQITSFPKE